MNKCFVKQRDAMDCGPSCIAIIAMHYGLQMDMSTLRTYCGLGKDGVSLLGISKALEKIGFATKGKFVTFDALCSMKQYPCIAYWNQNHFVVIYEIRKLCNGQLRVYVGDPAKGILSYSAEEFCAHWECKGKRGVILLVEPSQDVRRKAKKKNRYKLLPQLQFLWAYVRGYKSIFAQLLLGMLLSSVLQIILPFLAQLIVDVGIARKEIRFIWLIVLGQVILLLSRIILDCIRSRLLLYLSTRINVLLISDFFVGLMKLPMRFFDVKSTGDLIQRVEDYKRVEQFLTGGGLSIAFSFFTLFVFGGMLGLYSLPILFIFLLGVSSYIGWTLLFLKQRRILDYQYFECEGKSRNSIYQLLEGIQEIKLQGCETRKRWEWETLQADVFQLNLKSLNQRQIQQVGGTMISEGRNLFITMFAAMAVVQNEMTLGAMLAIQYIMAQLNYPVEQLIQFIYAYQDVDISFERMDELKQETIENSKGKAVDSPNFAIRVHDVSFKYDLYGENDVLSDINLTIPKGKITAIVGASGSGKTTLIKLLLGFYIPQQGTILLEDQPLIECDLRQWRTQSGVVMQEGYLFSDTIARNIAISDETPDMDRVHYAARMACISTYIESLPLAYDTLIGVDGQSVSQGQRQRILIARVIYKNPEFIFLDEATNSLDAINERQITENLEEFYKGKTVVVIAHRLSTVCKADQIAVLSNGRIVEIGSHTELVAQHGQYFELVRNQLELGT